MQFTSISGFCVAALGLDSRRRFGLSSGSHRMFAACSFIQYMLLYRIVDYAVKQ
jgi:hypothetical protein